MITEQQATTTEQRNVSVSENGMIVSILEDDDGEVSIPELCMLDTGKRQMLSTALCIWKYGIVPCD